MKWAFQPLTAMALFAKPLCLLLVQLGNLRSHLTLIGKGLLFLDLNRFKWSLPGAVAFLHFLELYFCHTDLKMHMKKPPLHYALLTAGNL